MLTLGTGVGGAVLIGGELYRGASGAAGELGHIVAHAAKARDCGPGCPSRGCLEALRLRHRARARGAGGGAARARERPGRALAAVAAAGPIVTELAHDGDAARGRCCARWASGSAWGSSSLVNIFNPAVS